LTVAGRRGPKLAILAVFGVAIAAHFALDRHYFTLEALKENRDALLVSGAQPPFSS
jgi:hypothetical protein